MKNKWEYIYRNKKESYKYYNLFKPHESMNLVIQNIKNQIKKETNKIKILDLGPCLILGPGDLDKAHTINESIELTYLDLFEELFHEIIYNI